MLQRTPSQIWRSSAAPTGKLHDRSGGTVLPLAALPHKIGGTVLPLGAAYLSELAEQCCPKKGLT
jgi:hypothetical protein